MESILFVLMIVILTDIILGIGVFMADIMEKDRHAKNIKSAIKK